MVSIVSRHQFSANGWSVAGICSRSVNSRGYSALQKSRKQKAILQQNKCNICNNPLIGSMSFAVKSDSIALLCSIQEYSRVKRSSPRPLDTLLHTHWSASNALPLLVCFLLHASSRSPGRIVLRKISVPPASVQVLIPSL